MTYNQDTKEYAFHSQVQASAPTADEEKLPNKQVITKRKKKLQDSQVSYMLLIMVFIKKKTGEKPCVFSQ